MDASQRPRTACRSHRAVARAVAVIVALGGAAACGDVELFVPDLAPNERLIHDQATARLTRDDHLVDRVVAAGDLDGDGIDDAIVSSLYEELPLSSFPYVRGALYVVYGGALSGQIDLSALPSLTGFSTLGPEHIAAVGDVDGDGLADVLTTSGFEPVCAPHPPGSDDGLHGGAHLVYGSRTRLTGTTSVASAGVFLRDPAPCPLVSDVFPLGDFDGDGLADFAILRVTGFNSYDLLVFYGDRQRLSGVDDFAAAADAVIHLDHSVQVVPVGDVDGDGRDDFFAAWTAGSTDDLSATTILVHGAAIRLTGTVGFDDLAQSRFLDHTPPLVAGLGDLDGDGVDDFAMVDCTPVGTYECDLSLRVFYGRRTGFPAEVGAEAADATVHLGTGGPGGIASGDVDGDGVRELIVSNAAANMDNGAVYVVKATGRLSGTLEATTAATAYLGTEQHGQRCEYVLQPACVLQEQVGRSLGVADLTGDHRADILVAAPTNQGKIPDVGVHGSGMGHAYLLSFPAPAKP